MTRPVTAVGNSSSFARMPTTVPSSPLPSIAIARAANRGRAASRSLRAELDTITTLRGHLPRPGDTDGVWDHKLGTSIHSTPWSQSPRANAGWDGPADRCRRGPGAGVDRDDVCAPAPRDRSRRVHIDRLSHLFGPGLCPLCGAGRSGFGPGQRRDGAAERDRSSLGGRWHHGEGAAARVARIVPGRPRLRGGGDTGQLRLPVLHVPRHSSACRPGALG